jgi:hypothetical protein
MAKTPDKNTLRKAIYTNYFTLHNTKLKFVTALAVLMYVVLQ